MSAEIRHFKNQEDFRTWLQNNHKKEKELWVGFYKVGSQKPSITWPESVEEALCFGWIDGIRKSVDEVSYKIRFTPRRPNSHWSAKNIKTVKELVETNKMCPFGLEAFNRRKEENSRQASHEQKKVELKTEYEDKIKANKEAWKFFEKLAPGYTKQSVHWVMSAKQEKTRLRRLAILIESCEEGQKIPQLRR